MGGKNSPESINRYMAKAYDRISLIVPKGQKELIQAHAEAQGESTNGFINRAISETMERDKGKQAMVKGLQRNENRYSPFYDMILDYN